MTEKINGQGLKATDTASTRRAETAKPASKESQGAASRGAAPATTGDTVNITPSGMLMSKLEEVVQSAPIVDSKRVAAIKDALAMGNYEIDDQRVANRMLKFERDVLG
jgi:negative regulator of flagellin synthesis FlgM